jgi:RNA polymerase sigma factor (sigma-70 family)
VRTDDGSVIHECLNGEPGAFGVLVDKYKEGIYSFVYDKLRDFQDAQDVTQEVFLQAYRGLRSLRRWESFGFWLYRIAYARCSQWLRVNSRRADREFIEDQNPEIVDIRSLNSYRDDQLSETLQDALDSLSEKYREVLMLHYFGGMNSKEIARVIGASPGAIRVRLSRARAQLREEMVAMMDTAFEEQRLPAGFTFHIVEAIKRIKIHPMPRMSGLPWGSSLTAGLILAVMTLSSHLSLFSPANTSMMRLALPAKTKVLKAGEIPVDVLDLPQIPALAGKQWDNREPEFLDPQSGVPIVAESGRDTWGQRTDMPTARFYCAASVLDGKIYILGGCNAYGREGDILLIVEMYDPTTDAWTRKADMPSARVGLSAAVVDGRIYAFGGVSEPDSQKMEVYDPVTDAWTTKGDTPGLGLWFPSSVVDGRIYAFGGTGCRVVQEYDPATDTWASKAEKPLLSWEGMCSSVVNGKIYVFGGEINADTVVPNVFEYDPATDGWEQKADMPTPRAGAAAAVVNEKVYIIGGHRPFTPLTLSPGIPTVEVYDPATDTWEKRMDMPTARTVLSTGVVKGRIYAIGGGEANFAHVLSALEVYTPGDAPTTVCPQGKRTTRWGGIRSN